MYEYITCTNYQITKASNKIHVEGWNCEGSIKYRNRNKRIEPFTLTPRCTNKVNTNRITEHPYPSTASHVLQPIHATHRVTYDFVHVFLPAALRICWSAFDLSIRCLASYISTQTKCLWVNQGFWDLQMWKAPFCHKFITSTK